MFLVREIFRSICRRKGFSLMTGAAGAFLFLFLGIYMGNLENIRNALETMRENLPVSVKITNANGSEDIGLEIRAAQFDVFAGSGITDLVYTAQAGGNREEKEKAGPVLACDTTIKAANSLAAFAGLKEEDFSFDKGFDISYLAGREPWCTVDEQYGKLYGIEPGDSLELSLCQIKYKSDDGSFQFLPLGRTSLKVIGTYRNSGQLSDFPACIRDQRPPSVSSSPLPEKRSRSCPVSWTFPEAYGGIFIYKESPSGADRLHCKLADPANLGGGNFTNGDGPDHGNVYRVSLSGNGYGSGGNFKV